jgi:hypothetical protein
MKRERKTQAAGAGAPLGLQFLSLSLPGIILVIPVKGKNYLSAYRLSKH